MAKNIILVAFMVVWGAVVLIVAIQEKGKVPTEYWTIPAIGIGAIMGAFSAIEDRRNNRNNREPDAPSTDPNDDGST